MCQKNRDDTDLWSAAASGERMALAMATSSTDHGPVLSEFFDWCQSSFLHINVAKTKEMCIDFRKSSSVLSPALIGGQAVEVVQEYKYLGVMMDNKLTFESQVDAI
ncbi:hypothetical protein WMY93_031420 [Mugilogobius chulae]|uniref:Reverse transcriptase n=1 Tax=Mugilogobius chulae TaxID=88201 RepID=A0AAW0MMG1_9GOBI